MSPIAFTTLIDAKFAVAKAVVATFVELSPVVCVVAVVPLGSADAALSPVAVPVVFWFSTGMSLAVIDRNPGAPALPLGAAKKVFAAWLGSVGTGSVTVPVNVGLVLGAAPVICETV
jgi:hypothetical protein